MSYIFITGIAFIVVFLMPKGDCLSAKDIATPHKPSDLNISSFEEKADNYVNSVIKLNKEIRNDKRWYKR